MITEIGPVEIEVSRDTASSFDPQLVRKRQRRLTGVDEIVLSLSAKGLTTGEIAAHFDDVYGAKVSKGTISRITDKVLGEMAGWANRPWKFLPFERSSVLMRLRLLPRDVNPGRYLAPAHVKLGDAFECRGVDAVVAVPDD